VVAAVSTHLMGQFNAIRMLLSRILVLHEYLLDVSRGVCMCMFIYVRVCVCVCVKFGFPKICYFYVCQRLHGHANTRIMHNTGALPMDHSMLRSISTFCSRLPAIEGAAHEVSKIEVSMSICPLQKTFGRPATSLSQHFFYFTYLWSFR